MSPQKRVLEEAAQTMLSLTPGQIRGFRRTVYGHYAHHGRDLPWRQMTEPYHILVSEVMLQQTQVERVCEKFVCFVRAFPDIQTLAAAPLEAVLRQWQGLGYNRRAKHLREAAQMIMSDFGGQLPDTPQQLRTLPGIGTATAASIAAFAFNRPVAFIETNIRSVYIHHFFGDRDGIDDTELMPLIEQTLDRRTPFRWYSALMDYGVSLKRAVPNPSRRSLQHTTQSRFEGSDRQVRGRLLKALLQQPKSCTRGQLEELVNDSQGRVARLVQQLCDEGLVQRVGSRYRLGQ
jgi:A/G-specific adenine glycosylase